MSPMLWDVNIRRDGIKPFEMDRISKTSAPREFGESFLEETLMRRSPISDKR